MRRRLAWTAIHFAHLVQHVLECILGLHWPLRLRIRLHLPTASCSPLFLLILDSGHLPTAILSVWLLIFLFPLFCWLLLFRLISLRSCRLSPWFPASAACAAPCV